MNIKSMLVRLQSAMGRNDLVENMVLLPGVAAQASESGKCPKSVNFVVGYNSSPSSQTALDMTLWMAHQTRLATSAQVIVQVVYVVEDEQNCLCPAMFSTAEAEINSRIPKTPLTLTAGAASRTATSVLTQPKHELMAAQSRMKSVEVCDVSTEVCQIHPFEQADRILWQARCLAEEWRGSFKAHLRFGYVADELRKVVESEAAALLFLGCCSAEHPVVQKLGSDFPCPVLGVPTQLSL